jgi:hypothetical protein
MEDFAQATDASPLTENHRWEHLVDIKLTNLPEETDLSPNEMFVDWFEALYPSNGHGGEALKWTYDCADKNNLTLLLKPRSVAHKTLNEEAVRSFYGKRGFVQQGALMVREPAQVLMPQLDQNTGMHLTAVG